MVATVVEPSESILGSDEVKHLGDCLVERFLGPSRRLAQGRLELREGQLDRRQVWRVRGQEQELAADRLEVLANDPGLVHREVVEHDDLPWPQRGTQEVPNVD